MTKIKRIKVDRYEQGEYGLETWCRIYLKYRGQFYKMWQLVLSDRELDGIELAFEIAKREKEMIQHIKSLRYAY